MEPATTKQLGENLPVRIPEIGAKVKKQNC